MKAKPWIEQAVDIAQVATAIAAVAGLIFAVVQIRSLERAMDRSDRQNNIAAIVAMEDQQLRIDQAFIDRPDYRKYFYEGVSISRAEPEFNRVKSLAEEVTDFFGNAEDMINYLPPDRTTSGEYSNRPDAQGMLDRKTWEAYIVGMFRTSPIMCLVIDEHRDWYDDGMIYLADRGCPKLQPAAVMHPSR